MSKFKQRLEEAKNNRIEQARKRAKSHGVNTFTDRQLSMILKLQKKATIVNKLNGLMMIAGLVAMFGGVFSWLFFFEHGWRVFVAGGMIVGLSMVIYHFWRNVEQEIFEEILKDE